MAVDLLSLGGVITDLAVSEVSEDTTPVLGGGLDGGGFSIGNFTSSYKNETGTTYTFVSEDSGLVLTLSNASAITATLPNDLPIGWSVAVIQKGAGQITLSAASGATINNISSHTKSSGQYGIIGLSVIENSDGSSAVYILNGNTAS